MTMTLDQIRAALQDRNLSAVARATGVAYNTLYAIARRPDVNPSYRTVATLSAYLSKESYIA